VTLHPDALTNFLRGDHGAPFDLLGPHASADGLTVRHFRPYAVAVHLLLEGTGERLPMTCLDKAGLYEITLPDAGPDTRYRVEITWQNGETLEVHDPYASYPPLLTEYDLYLFGEGRLLYAYEKLGAHARDVDGVRGVNFAVWAPNAYQVSVIGPFNGWDSRVHGMRRRDGSGVWEIFIPDIAPGAIYRYAIRSSNGGFRAEKADPYGFSAERRPATASIVADLSYTWGDDAWIEARAERPLLGQPMSTYEVHLGSWRRDENGDWLDYRTVAHELVAYAVEMGYTHLELMPVAEHPLDASWGYQIAGYYAPTSRFGSPTDFKYFVDHCHQHNIGVILDWVPAHFPKDGHALGYFDGTHLYEHADPRQGEHPDWGTFIFNYGRNEVRNFLISNALYWLKEYHIDGLRVDAVSSMLYLDFSRQAGQWIPNEYGSNENLPAIAFLRELNEIVHRELPGAVTVAEESTAWPMVSRPIYIGGLGFTLKWNMGWMHDTLRYMSTDPVYRRYAHNQVTFSLAYAFSENFVLALSHDEVVHGKGSLMGKMAGDTWQKLAALRLLYGYQHSHPGKKLLFMGQEFGQWREWSEERSLDWDLLETAGHRQLQAWVRDLNHLYQQQPALYEHDFDWNGFQWIDPNDADQSVLSYIRYADDQSNFVVIVCNFTPVVRYEYRIGVPVAGTYAELMNSDSDLYGGSNVGNGGAVTTDDIHWHTWDQSMLLTLPPLGVLILKLQSESAPPAKTTTALSATPALRELVAPPSA
jgi:1,4-alpha-glucan branching enzyme